MHDFQRYRDKAAECLLAAQDASQPHNRKLWLSMAVSWLSLARQDEAIDYPDRPTRARAEACGLSGRHH